MRHDPHLLSIPVFDPEKNLSDNCGGTSKPEREKQALKSEIAPRFNVPSASNANVHL